MKYKKKITNGETKQIAKDITVLLKIYYKEYIKANQRRCK